MRSFTWKFLVFISITLFLIDGWLRAGLPANFGRGLFLVKDLLLFIILLYVINDWRGLLKNVLFSYWGRYVLLVFAISTLQFLIYGPNALIFIYGLKKYTLYLLVAIAIKHSCETISVDNVIRWLKIFIPIFILITLVGLQQHLTPPGQLQELVDNPALVAGLGLHRSRAFATFSYITGYTHFNIILVVISVVLLLRREVPKYYPFIIIVCGLIGMATNFSRISFIFLLYFGLLLFLHVLIRRNVVGELLSKGSRVVGFLMIALLFLMVAYITSSEDIFSRIMINDYLPRVFNQLFGGFYFVDSRVPLGNGVGTALQAAPLINSDMAPYSWLATTKYFETESERVAIEFGLLGVILDLFFRCYVLLLVAKTLFGNRARLNAGNVVLFASSFFFIFAGIGTYSTQHLQLVLSLCLVYCYDRGALQGTLLDSGRN